jgi:hypothetical protein
MFNPFPYFRSSAGHLLARSFLYAYNGREMQPNLGPIAM